MHRLNESENGVRAKKAEKEVEVADNSGESEGNEREEKEDRKGKDEKRGKVARMVGRGPGKGSFCWSIVAC